MPKALKNDREWLIRHLSRLIEVGNQIHQFDASLLSARPPTYNKGYWSALKLLLLKYYVKPYLDILGNQKTLGYVDLFAGPGLNLLGKRQVPFPGSPLIPLTIQESKHDFSYFCFCDRNPSFAAALEKRCEYSPRAECTTVLDEDANEVVKTLAGRLEEHNVTHSLVFIDPEGLELDWMSLQTLIETVPCDIIVNFPSAGIVRVMGVNDPASRQTISRFLGVPVDSVPPEASEDWAIEAYRQNLAGLGKDISAKIKVMGERSFHYHLIPAVRNTVSGSPWFNNIFGGAKRRIERISPKVLGIVADQIEGRQKTLF